MQISVSGKQINIGSALQDHVKDRLSKGVTKYFDRALTGNVVFSRQAHLFCANIMVNEGTGMGVLLKSDAESDDIYSAFDAALLRIEKQLRRYKSKIKSHHKPKIADLAFSSTSPVKGTKYVISPFAHHDTDEMVEETLDNPLIIAEKTTAIETLAVSEAVMKMDLAHLPALLFINSKTGRINVVYHRADGNISWVDPESGAA
jgi:ribosomal subunit interface protein